MDYFGFVRTEISPLLPTHAKRVLELGCGSGATLAWLKQTGHCDEIIGVEYSHDASAMARQQLDLIVEGNAEQLDFSELGRFDLVLCLDVLEHLRDPWLMLRRLRDLLTPTGQLIVSIPNIRHHSVLMPLLFKGEWRYSDAGILDQTHLRFFTQKTAQSLIEQAGFEVTETHGAGQQWAHSRFWRWLGRCTWAQPFCAVQYLYRAQLKS